MIGAIGGPGRPTVFESRRSPAEHRQAIVEAAEPQWFQVEDTGESFDLLAGELDVFGVTANSLVNA
jgi:hypothetical protein